MKIACPSCGKGLSVPDERAGSKTRCPACKQVFVVPPPEEDVPEAELFDETATIAAPGASAQAAAKASADQGASKAVDLRAKQLKAKLAEGKMFLSLAQTNLAESRPDLLELDLAREAFDLVLNLSPAESEAQRGLARVAELRGKTESAIESLRAAAKAPAQEAESPPAEESHELATTNEQVPAKAKKKSMWEHVSNFFTKYVCPKCNARGGVETNHEIIDRCERYRSDIQTDYHYASDGYTQTGRSDREVQVLYEVVVYDQYYRCEDCGHEWGERLTSSHKL